MFSLIDCCPTLNVLLENDVKDKWGKYEGVYTFQGFSDEMDYWVDAEGGNAIWYKTSGSTYYWIIGNQAILGSFSAHIASSSDTLEKKCPNNEGYVWNWMYGDYTTNSFFATNDVYIKCVNEDDYCTSKNPCGTNHGDCDTHDECQDGLFCGSNDCLDSLGFHSEFDCCYEPTVGDEHFCTTADPCAVDEGDCDTDNECQLGLFCEITISCPAYLGFASDVNCCSSGSGCEYILQLLVMLYLLC